MGPAPIRFRPADLTRGLCVSMSRARIEARLPRAGQRKPYESRDRRIARQGEDHQQVSGQGLWRLRLVRPCARSRPVAARGGGGARHRQDGGDVSSWQAGGGASAQPAAAPADNGCRAHAELASAIPRLDARAHPERSRGHRRRHRSPGRDHPALASASRAGVPLLHRHPATGPALRRRTARRRLRPRARPWHALIQLGPEIGVALGTCLPSRRTSALSGRRDGEYPLDVPGHGDEAPFAARAIEAAQKIDRIPAPI